MYLFSNVKCFLIFGTFLLVMRVVHAFFIVSDAFDVTASGHVGGGSPISEM